MSVTKQKFVTAVMTLAKDKPVDAITIREITELAGLSSMTFYRHFLDKYELFLYIVSKSHEDIVREWIEGDLSYHDISVKSAYLYKDMAPFILNAYEHTTGQDSLLRKSADHYIELIGQYIIHHTDFDELPEEVEFSLRCYVRGAISMFLDWAHSKFKMSPEQYATLLQIAMPDIIKQYIK